MGKIELIDAHAEERRSAVRAVRRLRPLGPWLVTANEVRDPHSLTMRCLVSGRVVNHATTADSLVSIPELLERVSQTLTLEPGDVVVTQTPWPPQPPMLLNGGDELALEFEGLGRLVAQLRTGDPTGI